MKKKELIELCIREFDPMLKEKGFFIDDVEYVTEPKGNVLRFYIDKESGSIDIFDCQTCSEIISEKLDEIDPIEDSYFLEVSSPGIDRPFKRDSDYEKNIGEMVEVKFYGKVLGKKEVIGELLGLKDGVVSINIDGTIHEISKSDIASIRLALFY